jgi:DNA-binding ferritin-like protein
VKTKNFQWALSGPHFRDYHAEYFDPLDMLAELGEDNRTLIASMRKAHDLRDEEERRRYRTPVGDVDRRDGAAHLVPLRIVPAK